MSQMPQVFEQDKKDNSQENRCVFEREFPKTMDTFLGAPKTPLLHIILLIRYCWI